MNKVWRSSVAEGDCEFILALPLKLGHSQNGHSVAPAVWVLPLNVVIRSFSVAHIRKTEMGSVLSSYKQMHDQITNSKEKKEGVYFLGN